MTARELGETVRVAVMLADHASKPRADALEALDQLVEDASRNEAAEEALVGLTAAYEAAVVNEETLEALERAAAGVCTLYPTIGLDEDNPFTEAVAELEKALRR